jgi:hypothetical protein
MRNPPAQRAAQSQRIHEWKPWEKTTGPKTVAGKASVSQNARKHTPRTVPTVSSLRADRRALEGLLRLHLRCPMMAMFEESRELRQTVVEQLILRHQLLGLSFDEALAQVQRLIQAELRHQHRLPN